MYTIDYLEKEHDLIINLTNNIEKNSLKILDGEDVDVEFFRNVIIFIRKFADGEHHKKEEDILFKYMIVELGDLANKLITNGMLVEHDMARFYVRELEKYLDEYEKEKTQRNKLFIINYAMSYAELLRRHVDKENNVVYTFANRALSDEIKKTIEAEMKERVKEEEALEEEKNDLIKKLNI